MKKGISIFVIIILIILIVFGLAQINKGKIELTQLSSHSKDRMMGYIVRTQHGKTIVIDGGMSKDTDNLKEFLKKYNNHVDYWFITHPHMDHAGAFINIIDNDNNIKIDNVYYSANDLDWYKKYAGARVSEIEDFYRVLENDKIKQVEKQPQIGEAIKIDNVEIEILGINNPEITTNPINNSSMVFKLKVNNKSILFLGDTGEESSNKLVKEYGKKLKSDIVQVAHHGQQGATEELYKLVDPEICLWPTEEWLWNNDYGQGFNTGPFKTLETREWMEKLNVKKNYVAKDGDVTIEIK